jgi:hypothetical protein
LLRELERGGGAGAGTRFDQRQHARGPRMVERGDLAAFGGRHRLQPVRRDTGQEREPHRVAVEHAGLQAAPYAVAGRAMAAPEVDLVLRAEACAQAAAGDDGLAAEPVLPARVELRRELRLQRGTGDAYSRIGLRHACGRGRQVEVPGQRLRAQRVELGAAEGLPAGAGSGTVGRGRLPLRRQHGRCPVGWWRRRRTGCEQQAGAEGDEASVHAFFHSPASATTGSSRAAVLAGM